MTFYTEMQATAHELIEEFGQAGSLVRFTASGPSYDPTLTPASYGCTLVDLDVDEELIDGTLILRSDRTVYLSTKGLTIVPTLADKILIGGTEHAIIDVKPLQPGGTVVFWQLQARK